MNRTQTRKQQLAFVRSQVDQAAGALDYVLQKLDEGDLESLEDAAHQLGMVDSLNNGAWSDLRSILDEDSERRGKRPRAAGRGILDA